MSDQNNREQYSHRLVQSKLYVLLEVEVLSIYVVVLYRLKATQVVLNGLQDLTQMLTQYEKGFLDHGSLSANPDHLHTTQAELQVT